MAGVGKESLLSMEFQQQQLEGGLCNLKLNNYLSSLGGGGFINLLTK